MYIGYRPLHGSRHRKIRSSHVGVRKFIPLNCVLAREFLVKKKVPTCCIVDCENRTSSGVKFFRIPTGSHPFKKNRHLWLQAIKRADWDNATIKEARVCSAHFISGSVKPPLLTQKSSPISLYKTVWTCPQTT